jgi:glutamyl-tRNA synthetase
MVDVRTRFAPSPTGYLHIGGARTALFNWLFSRHHGGKFILRIEDTDRLRSTEQFSQEICESLAWLGLDWDGGPYYQSQRSHIYHDHIEKLLKEGKVYRCYCTPHELEERRKKARADGKKPKYDRRCRELTRAPDKPAAMRLKAPQHGTTQVDDLVRGAVAFENAELDDLILCRADGVPTYNFVVVVDDATMGISHVIRGDDHLNNTPRQMLIYQALGYQPPQFAHVPLILGQDKTRLSKRHGATSVLAYKEMGYLPEALVNFLVRLGWSHGDQEIFSRQELIEKFSLASVGKSAGVFNLEKLTWLTMHYIKTADTGKLAGLLLPFLKERGLAAEPGGYLNRAVDSLKERSKTLVEMADQAQFYFTEEIEYQPKAARKFLTPEMGDILSRFIDSFQQLASFRAEDIETVFKNIQESSEKSLTQLAQATRVALTGGTVSPGIYETMEILGRDRVIKRLTRAADFVRQQGEEVSP